MSVPSPLRSARAAFAFLTRLPIGGHPYTEHEMSWSPAWFPLVGLVVGLGLAGVWMLGVRLGAWPAAALVLAAGMLATGAFHEDGLADSADALGGATSRERVFEILKDSRIGTFGAAALMISLLLRASAWVELGPRATHALVLTQCLSRVPPVWLMAALPYVSGSASKSRSVVSGSWLQAGLATVWPAGLLIVAIATGALGVSGAVWLVVIGMAAAAVCGWYFWARVGGVTGDFLGATQQVVEAVGCLTLVAMSRGER